MTQRLMPLAYALTVLSRVHTQDDDKSGFAVVMGAMPDTTGSVSHSDYIHAWRSVRHALGQPIDGDPKYRDN